MKIKILLLFLAMVFCLPLVSVYSATISVESVTVKSGDTFDVEFALNLSETEDVSAFNFDFNFDSSILSVVSVTDGVAALNAGKTVAYNEISAGVERVLVYSYDNVKISSGVFMMVTFKVDSAASSGQHTLSLNNLVFSSSLATASAGNGINGIVTIDNDSPVITITSPADGDTVADTVVRINGSIDDTNINAIDINGNTVNVNAGIFSYDVSLTEGSNTITITAVDVVGNSSDKVFTVIRDTIAPVITVTAPSSGDKVNTKTVIVSGSVDDNTIADIDINGNSVSVSNGEFSAEIPVVEGSFDVVITVTDSVGNSSVESVNIEVDLTAPIITISSPVDGESFGRKSIVVSGMVDDVDISNVDINGNTVAVNSGNFSQSIDFDEGDITVSATAVDAAGNTASDSVDISIAMGDVNEDGIIDNNDIVNTKNQILGLASETITADVNTDGNVNVLDLQLVINKS